MTTITKTASGPDKSNLLPLAMRQIQEIDEIPIFSGRAKPGAVKGAEKLEIEKQNISKVQNRKTLLIPDDTTKYITFIMLGPQFTKLFE